MCPFLVFFNVSFGANFNCVQTYTGLHWFLSILFFTTKIFITGICLSLNSTLVCLKAALVEFHMNWFPPLPPNSPPLQYTSSSISLLTSSPSSRKTNYIPTLRSHPRGMAAWQLHTGRLLCRFLRIGYYQKQLKNAICTTITHFMHRNYLINKTGFILVVPL